MRTPNSLFAGALAGLVIAGGALAAAGCYDDEATPPGATTTSSGGAGQGGSPGTTLTAMGGDTATAPVGGSTMATGGTMSTGGSASTGGDGTGGIGTGGSVAQMVPDFSLVDMNPASSTGGEPVSPRDYLGRVSAWYFGHST